MGTGTGTVRLFFLFFSFFLSVLLLALLSLTFDIPSIHCLPISIHIYARTTQSQRLFIRPSPPSLNRTDQLRDGACGGIDFVLGFVAVSEHENEAEVQVQIGGGRGRGWLATVARVSCR